MKKRTLGLAALSVVVPALTLGAMVPTAEAATTQKYCNSSASRSVIDIQSSSTNPSSRTTLGPGDCTSKPSTYIVYYPAGSYRAGYDYGDYGSCRTNNYFNAYDAPKVLYFKTYTENDCTNVVSA